MKKNKFESVDIFAGIGGIRLAFENVGFKTLFAIDDDKRCKLTYDLNFRRPKLLAKDISKVYIKEIPDFDVLLAGFPCQAFSRAGNQIGFRDEKGGGNLFFKIAQFLKIKTPQAFMLENVKNLKYHYKGQTLQIIKHTLEKLGYHIKFEVLNSTTHGNIPQNRERLFLVGFLDKNKTERFEFPQKIPLTRNFKEFVFDKIEDKYYYNDGPVYEKLNDYVTSERAIFQLRKKHIRSNVKGIVPTLTASMGMKDYNNVPIIKDYKGFRKLTPKECFVLQGFPKNFKLPNLADKYLYHQAGNSVTVPVVQRIAENMKKVME